MFCPNCGNPIESGQKFCAACGASLERSRDSEPSPAPEEQAQPEPQPEAPSKKRRWPIVAGAVVGVCALVAIVVFVILPLTQPHGIWVETKCTTHGEWDDGSTNDYVDEYTNDERGRLMSHVNVFSTSFHPDDEEKTTYTYTYDDEGHCVSEEVTDYDKTTKTTYTWNTDESGRTVSVSSSSDDDADEGFKIFYGYNDKGDIIRWTLRDDDGKEAVTDYLSDGSTAHIVDKRGDYTQERTFLYEHDDNNRAISCIVTIQDQDTGEVSNVITRTFEYDENGSLVHETSENIYYFEDDTTETYKAESTYEYEYIEEPLPWIVQLHHLNHGLTILL